MHSPDHRAVAQRYERGTASANSGVTARRFLRNRFGRLAFATVLLVGPGLTAFAQQSDKAQPAPMAPPQAAPAAPPKSEAAPTKPPEKSRKVYTNDDFTGGGGPYFRPLHEILDQVNECDRNCFNQVANDMKEPNGGSVEFKRQLLRDVESTRNDRDWQTLLLDAVHIKEKYCQFVYDKNAELAKLPDRNKVTDRELDIDERYNKKYEDAADDVTEIYRRENAFLLHNDHITRALMQYQVVRIMSANCTPPRSAPPDDPEPADPDPNDP